MPAKSEKQRRLWGSAYGAKKEGKGKPTYVPTSIWNQPMGTMEEFASNPVVKGRKKSKHKKGKKK